MNQESASIHVLPPGAHAPTAQVISLGELHPDAPRAHAALPVVPSFNPLHAVKARLQVSVGELEISIGELLAARESQVFVLDRAVDQPVDLLIEGKVVARAELVAVEGRFGLRITELPQPLKP